MKIRTWSGLCLLGLVCATTAVAQQGNDAAIQIISGQIKWINSMVAQNKMSQADASAQITNLKLQLADLVLNSQTPTSGTPPEHETAPANQGQSAAAVTQDGTESKPPCPSDKLDTSLSVPKLNPIGAGTDPITGSVGLKDGKYPSGGVQLCLASSNNNKTSYTILGTSQINAKDGKFSVPPSGSLPRVKSGDKITAQFVTGTITNGTIPTPTSYGPPSLPAMVGSCKAAEGSGAAPTLTGSTDSTGKVFTYSGSVKNAPRAGAIRICADDIAVPDAGETITNGVFNGSFILPKGTGVVAAQVVSGSAKSPTYSKLSTELPVGACSAVEKGDSSTKPTLNPLSIFSDPFSGTMPDAKVETVRLCVTDFAVAAAPVRDGRFEGALPKSLTLKAKESVAAQGISSAPGSFPKSYGLLSSPQIVSGFNYSSRPYATFIAGVEQSGFSSQGSSTNAFLEAYFRGAYHRLWKEKDTNPFAATIWGRIRLLGGPLPSGTSVTAAFTNPSGTITSSTITNVGQVVDYVFGPELRIRQWDKSNGNTDRVSLIGGVGATTPLNSSGIQYSLAAPTVNSQQCFQLLNDSPYSSLFTNVSRIRGGCAIGDAKSGNPISTLSFAPIDRSNFLVKYGAGVRFTHVYPAKNGQVPYSGDVDFVVGQDQEITGGKFQGVVFGINAVYPLALGSSSFVYLFGSASMKTTGTQYYPPLVLGTAPTPTPPLPASVEVVPLGQPNRDFYRFGVGVNVMSLFCSASKKCNSSTGSGATSNSGSAATTDSAN